MNRKNIFIAVLAGAILFAFSCNSNDAAKTDSSANGDATKSEASSPLGIGPYTKIELTHPLDEKMVAEGKNVYEVKCASCHKLTDEKLVGPGWKGVTDRRTPEWIMNFIVNVEEMLEKDTAAQNMLEICLVKMPNQDLTDTAARSTLEFMRKNDGKN